MCALANAVFRNRSPFGNTIGTMNTERHSFRCIPGAYSRACSKLCWMFAFLISASIAVCEDTASIVGTHMLHLACRHAYPLRFLLVAWYLNLCSEVNFFWIKLHVVRQLMRLLRVGVHACYK